MYIYIYIYNIYIYVFFPYIDLLFYFVLYFPIFFEGVSVTTVILAPGACGGRLRAAAHDSDSAAPAAPAECSKNGVFHCFYNEFGCFALQFPSLA